MKRINEEDAFLDKKILAKRRFFQKNGFPIFIRKERELPIPVFRWSWVWDPRGVKQIQFHVKINKYWPLGWWGDAVAMLKGIYSNCFLTLATVLVVMGGESWTRGCEFKSHIHLLNYRVESRQGYRIRIIIGKKCTSFLIIYLNVCTRINASYICDLTALINKQFN